MTELNLCDRNEDHGLATHRLTFTSGATTVHLDFCQTCVNEMTAEPWTDLTATVTITPLRGDGG